MGWPQHAWHAHAACVGVHGRRCVGLAPTAPAWGRVCTAASRPSLSCLQPANLPPDQLWGATRTLLGPLTAAHHLPLTTCAALGRQSHPPVWRAASGAVRLWAHVFRAAVAPGAASAADVGALHLPGGWVQRRSSPQRGVLSQCVQECMHVMLHSALKQCPQRAAVAAPQLTAVWRQRGQAPPAARGDAVGGPSPVLRRWACSGSAITATHRHAVAACGAGRVYAALHAGYEGEPAAGRPACVPPPPTAPWPAVASALRPAWRSARLRACGCAAHLWASVLPTPYPGHLHTSAGSLWT